MNIQRLLAWGALSLGLSLGGFSAFAVEPEADVATEVVTEVSTNAPALVVSNVVDAVATSNALVRALANLRTAFIEEELKLYEALVEDFDEKHTMYKKGDELSITRPNGIVAGGKLDRQTSTEVLLTQGTFEKKLKLKELQVGDRLRLDGKFRETWLQMESRTSARKALQERGEIFPDHNLSIKLQLEHALEYADPKACYLMAESYRVGLRQERDNGYAFLYNFMASKQGHVDARYDLGRMYYGAVAVLRNKRTGLQLIASAGADGHMKAEAFLAKHKVSATAMKHAAAAYRETQEKEAAMHAEQVERFNAANETRKVDRSRHDFKIGK